MKTVDLADATAPLSDYARAAERETVLVTRNGRPVAALVKVGRYTDLENLKVTTDPRFMAMIERSRRRQPPGSGSSTEEVRKRLGVEPRRQRRRSKGKTARG